jgi:8-oxo-dGTP pyrophosphatase MutT (NUDIX family)
MVSLGGPPAMLSSIVRRRERPARERAAGIAGNCESVRAADKLEQNGAPADQTRFDTALLDGARIAAMFSWLTRFIERHPDLHRLALVVWRWFPPRLAGFLKGVLARKWLVGAVAVMIDEKTSPPEVLLVKHSYRPRGAWGLPGGSLESTPGNPTKPRDDASADDAIQSALRREMQEELGIEISVMALLRIDAIPYIAEEPGPYRLDFYFRCAPREGFAAFRRRLDSGQVKPCSPEIVEMRLVPLTDLGDYDLFTSDARFLTEDLVRYEPRLAVSMDGSVGEPAREPA